MSYVALKASEVVLDGHWEVLLAVLLFTSIQNLESQAAGDRHSGEFQWEPSQWSCWWCFLRKPNPGTAFVSCSQTAFTKAVWLHETRTASRTSSCHSLLPLAQICDLSMQTRHPLRENRFACSPGVWSCWQGTNALKYFTIVAAKAGIGDGYLV